MSNFHVPLGTKSVFGPSRACAYHQFTGGFDCKHLGAGQSGEKAGDGREASARSNGFACLPKNEASYIDSIYSF